MKGALLLVGAGALLSLLAFRGVSPSQVLAALEAQGTVRSWDAGTARARLGGDVLVVDARRGRGGRPAGSFRVPPDAPALVPPPQGRAVRSALVVMEADRAAEARELAQRLLREWGLEEVATFRGGYEEWTAAGLPVQ